MQEYAYLTRNANCLQKFIASLLPLIKQCWIEEHCSEGTAAAAAHGATGAGTKNKQLESTLTTACIELES